MSAPVSTIAMRAVYVLRRSALTALGSSSEELRRLLHATYAFIAGLGTPLFRAKKLYPNSLPSKTDYNTMIEAAQSDLTHVRSVLPDTANHSLDIERVAVAELVGLTARTNTVRAHVGDAIVRAGKYVRTRVLGIGALDLGDTGRGLTFTETFSDLSHVDVSRTKNCSVDTAHYLASLQPVASDNLGPRSYVHIPVLSKDEQVIGLMGSTTEVVPVAEDQSGQVDIRPDTENGVGCGVSWYEFAGAKDSRDNPTALLDQNAQTWFEFERTAAYDEQQMVQVENGWYSTALTTSEKAKYNTIGGIDIPVLPSADGVVDLLPETIAQIIRRRGRAYELLASGTRRRRPSETVQIPSLHRRRADSSQQNDTQESTDIQSVTDAIAPDEWMVAFEIMGDDGVVRTLRFPHAAAPPDDVLTLEVTLAFKDGPQTATDIVINPYIIPSSVPATLKLLKATLDDGTERIIHQAPGTSGATAQLPDKLTASTRTDTAVATTEMPHNPWDRSEWEWRDTRRAVIDIADITNPPTLGPVLVSTDVTYHLPPYIRVTNITAVFEQRDPYACRVGHTFTIAHVRETVKKKRIIFSSTKVREYDERVKSPDMVAQLARYQHKVGIFGIGNGMQESDLQSLAALATYIPGPAGLIIGAVLFLASLWSTTRTKEVLSEKTGLDVFFGARWAVGLRGLTALKRAFEPTGELVSTAYTFDRPIRTALLKVADTAWKSGNNRLAWVEYDLSHNGSTWYPAADNVVVRFPEDTTQCYVRARFYRRDAVPGDETLTPMVYSYALQGVYA